MEKKLRNIFWVVGTLLLILIGANHAIVLKQHLAPAKSECYEKNVEMHNAAVALGWKGAMLKVADQLEQLGESSSRRMWVLALIDDQNAYDELLIKED